MDTLQNEKKRSSWIDLLLINRVVLPRKLIFFIVVAWIIYMIYISTLLEKIGLFMGIKQDLVGFGNEELNAVDCFETNNTHFHDPNDILVYSRQLYITDTTYELGGTAEIEIHPHGGLNITRGGDLFVVRGFSDNLPASISGIVQDLNNGVYLVRLPLLWPGRILLEIRLLVSKKLRFYLDLIRGNHFHENMFKRQAKFENKRSKQMITVNCEVKENVGESCDLSEFNAFFNWTCHRPKSTSCHDYVIERHFTMPDHPYPCTQLITTMKEVTILNDLVVTVESKHGKYESGTALQRFHSDYPFFYKGKWMTKSLRQFWGHSSSPNLSCITQGEFIFMGDSNARNAYSKTLEYISGKDPPYIPKGRSSLNSYNNVTLSYIAFGHSSVGTPDIPGNMRPISHLLNAVSNKTLSIYISIWAHITFFHPDNVSLLYYSLRSTLDKIKTKYPSVKVIIRLPHPRETPDGMNHRYRHNNLYAWDCLTLIKDIFKYSDVHFTDMWDVVVAAGGHYHIHPKGIAFQADMDMFRAHMCPF